MAVRKNALARIITNAATAPALALSADLPFGVQDDAYTGRVVASGGVGSYSYTVDSKPSWITATQVGQILECTGTVPFSGDGDITVTVTDSAFNSLTRTFHIETGGSIQPPNTGDGGGDPYSRIIVFTVGYGSSGTYDVHALLVNPTDPVTYTLTGSLPSGASFNSTTGVITWANITDVGLHLFEFVCIDANGGGARFSFRMTVTSEIVLPPDPRVIITYIGIPFEYYVSPTGGVPPYRFSTNGNLPQGIHLDGSTGRFYGTPVGPATLAPLSVDVYVRDSVTPGVAYEHLIVILSAPPQDAPENGITYGRKDGAWTPITPGGVTSVGVSTGASGVSVSGSPVTGSGTIALGLGTAAAADAGDFDAAGTAASAVSAHASASGAHDADNIDYDNGSSGLSATDVQAAIDEIAAGSGANGSVSAAIANTNDLQVGDGWQQFLPADVGPWSGWELEIAPSGGTVEVDILVGGTSVTTGGAKPSVTTGASATGSTSGWAATGASAGDMLRVEVSSVTGTVENVYLYLYP